MKSIKDSTKKISFFILLICLLNLAGTAYLISTIQHVKQILSGEQIFPLPKSLSTMEQRISLFEKIKPLFNQKSYDELYDLFDDSFKMKFTKNNLIRSTDKIYKFSGKLTDAAYSYYEAKRRGNLKQYDLYYFVRAENGSYEMKITIVQQGDEQYRIFGFKIEGL